MNKNTFCIYPWITVYLERNGDYTSCGHAFPGIPGKDNVYTTSVEDAWNNEYFKNLRSDLLAGIRNENCKVCWYKEDHGATSPRLEYNEAYKHLIKDLTNHATDQPIVLGLKSDNTCNLKCITCNHYQSSQHDKEVKQWKKDGIKIPSWFTVIEDHSKDTFYKGDYITENLDSLLKNNIKLEIQGGEPIISPVTHNILDYCIEHNYTNVELLFTTNLIGLTDSTIDKLSKFPKKSLWLSWDHIEEEKFKFIRYPAHYPMFLENLNRLVSSGNTNLGISIALSIFNISEILEILECIIQYSTDNNFSWHDIILRIVYKPDYFSIEYLEPEHKLEIIKKIEKFKYDNTSLNQSIIDICNLLKQDPENFEETVKERTRVLELYDITRNTNYKELFPWIKTYK